MGGKDELKGKRGDTSGLAVSFPKSLKNCKIRIWKKEAIEEKREIREGKR